MKVLDLCSPDAAVIEPGKSLREAALAMRNRHVGALVVVERSDGVLQPVGIVTDRDIVIAVLAVPGARPEGIRVQDVMPSRLFTVREDDSVFDALETMRRTGVRRLPVLSGDGSLRGIVTSDDLLRVLAGELADLAEAFRRGGERERSARQRLDPA